jgi:hypothetical protein
MEGIVVATRQPQPHVGWHLDSCWDLGHGRNFRDETTSPDCGRIGVGLPRSIRECRHTSVLLHTGRLHSFTTFSIPRKLRVVLAKQEIYCTQHSSQLTCS